MNNITFKLFVKTIISFLIISFAVDKLIYLSISQMDKKVLSGVKVGKVNHYLSIKDTTGLIVYGSSRATRHLNTSKMNGFNIGMDKKKIAFSATLIKLLPKNHKQTVVLHLDTDNFFNENYDGSDIKSLSNLIYRNEIVNKEFKKLNQNDLITNFYYTILYNNKLLPILKNYFFPKYDPKNYDGFFPVKTTSLQKKIFKIILNKKTSKPCPKNYKTNTIHNNYINEIISFCKENNKKLIVFTSPLYDDNCKEDNFLFTKIMNDKNIDYYDFTDFFNNNNDIKYWHDLGHLSNIGAEKFTNEFIKILN